MLFMESLLITDMIAREISCHHHQHKEREENYLAPAGRPHGQLHFICEHNHVLERKITVVKFEK